VNEVGDAPTQVHEGPTCALVCTYRNASALGRKRGASYVVTVHAFSPANYAQALAACALAMQHEARGRKLVSVKCSDVEHLTQVPARACTCDALNASHCNACDEEGEPCACHEARASTRRRRARGGQNDMSERDIYQMATSGAGVL
jgi:hypothetical protein